MPVVVQAMANREDGVGVAFSMFPCPKDIVKVVLDDVANRERHIDAFLRRTRDDGTHYVDQTRPLVVSKKTHRYNFQHAETLATLAVDIEDDFGYPIVMEFAAQMPKESSQQFRINLLQARRLTNLPEAKRFEIPELQERGLIATSYDVNGTGDLAAEAFVVRVGADAGEVHADGLPEFDAANAKGYILVTPYLRFYKTHLDRITPNKRAVVAYYDLGQHHDMEIAQKRACSMSTVTSV